MFPWGQRKVKRLHWDQMGQYMTQNSCEFFRFDIQNTLINNTTVIPVTKIVIKHGDYKVFPYVINSGYILSKLIFATWSPFPYSFLYIFSTGNNKLQELCSFKSAFLSRFFLITLASHEFWFPNSHAI